jgi:hypothetical protein
MEKEEIKGGAATQTAVEEMVDESKYNICAPLFIMFAEYLGYVGKTLPWVDQWCVAKKKPEEYKVKFIEIEAAAVLKEAKKKFSIERLRELYDALYEVILYIYDENLKDMEKTTEKA